MAAVGYPRDQEEVALIEYLNLSAAKLHIGRFFDDVYCTKRIHSSLGHLAPDRVRGSVVNTVIVTYTFK